MRGFVLATISDQPDIEAIGEINDYFDIERVVEESRPISSSCAGYAGPKTISLRRIVGAEPANEDNLSCFGAGAESQHILLVYTEDLLCTDQSSRGGILNAL